jgi:phosphopantetheinyl transferase
MHLRCPKKKRQWLAVRMLLAELGSSSTLISYDEQGKPFLQDQKIFISLSHSKDRAAIALDQRPTGIDIEYISEKIERVAGKFMSDDELARLPMHQKREALYVHWCVKEALYKLHGKKKLIFREQLILDPFQYNEKGNVTGNIVHDKKTERHELRYEKTGDYMLAYVSYN